MGNNNLDQTFNKLINGFEEIKFDCKKHGAVSVKVRKTSKGAIGVYKCPKCESEKEIKEKLEKLEKIKIEKLKKAGIRIRYFNSSFDNYNPVNETALKIINILKKSVEINDKESFLLYGNSGTGKTHLCSAAISKIGGIYTTWEWISIEIRASYSKASKESEAEILKRICSIPFLVIDEIDKGADTEAKKNTLSFIFRERYENCLSTWLAGNCNANWVNEMLDTSVIDRLKEGGRSLCFDWESYRPKLKD